MLEFTIVFLYLCESLIGHIFTKLLKLMSPTDIVLLKKKFIMVLSCMLLPFITDFVLTPANVDDWEAVWELVDTYKSITVIGDKGVYQ